MIRTVAAVAVATGLLTGCATPQPAPPRLADVLAGGVQGAALSAHLQALAEIAAAHEATRADGTPGFDASVEYVANKLRDKGFEVTTPEFDRLDTRSPGKPAVTVAGVNHPVEQASLLVRTPPGGVSGPVVRPRAASGCAAGDYPGAAARGAIVVTDDAGCSVVDKHNAAAAAGAAALIVISQPGAMGGPPGLFTQGYYQQLRIPVAVADRSAGAALYRATGPVKLVLDGVTVKITTRNILAQTKTGSTHDVVMVGAHLDSAPASPGINANGSGVAAVLETALQLGPSPAVSNAVRFAFWGAGEQLVAGSRDYVFGLGRDELNDIALYLNVDMVGSPNAGYFTYDGDQSAAPSREIAPEDVPDGSAGIERTLAGYINLAGKRPADMPLSSDTDCSPFLVAGIPIGGVTTGASQQKTKTQARLWGGKAGVAFDPNYRGAGDTVDNIDPEALAIMGSGVAFAVGTYAQSIAGVNGVAPHDQRNRTSLHR